MQNESSRLQKLLHTQIAKMDGEELVYLLQSFSKGEPEHHEPAPVQTEHKYVYGIAGIAQIFGCSIPTASRIKRSGVQHPHCKPYQEKWGNQRSHLAGRPQDYHRRG